MKPQKYWRKVASASLFASGVMAVYAVATDVVRDSLIHIVQLFSESANDMSPQHPFLFCFIYWIIFGVLIFVTLYIAMLDIRYIRLQFALEKKALVQKSWEGEDFRKMLKSTQQENNESKP